MKDYTLDIEEVKEYYADLLILQYHSKNKARETVKLGAEIYMGDGLVFQLQDVLDIDEAEGKQLDIIGKILDCPRNVPNLSKDEIEYFEFHKEGGSNGFSTSEKLSKGYFKSPNIDYLNGVTYLLNDKDYRVLLKFKAIANRAQASWQFIDELFYNIFGNAISITNNKDLSITYNIANNLVSDGLLAAIELGYLEPPIGIGSEILYSETHTLTINPTPATANVKLTASGYEQVGKTITAKRGTTITYEVSAENYVTQIGTYTIGENDETLTIDLVRYPKLVINTTPSDANITLKVGDKIIKTSSGVNNYFPSGTKIEYTINSDYSYEEQIGQLTILNDVNLYVTLVKKEVYTLEIFSYTTIYSTPVAIEANIFLRNYGTNETVDNYGVTSSTITGYAGDRIGISVSKPPNYKTHIEYVVLDKPYTRIDVVLTK